MKTTVFCIALLSIASLIAYTEGWLFSSSSGCSDRECQRGSCVQVGTTTMRSCPSRGYYQHDELRKKRGSGSNRTRYLYRILRDEEDARNDGITAKNPWQTRTIQSHVGCGSRGNYESQYISCTTDYRSALDFGGLMLGRAGRPTGVVTIAVIDRDGLERDGYVVHDLAQAGRDVLPGAMAFNFARRYNEALVEREIPAAYIVDVRHVMINGRNRC